MNRNRRIPTVRLILAGRRRFIGWLATAAFGVILSLMLGAPARAQYIIGADVSFAKQAETKGTVFKDNGKEMPVLQILKDHGYNWIRLRLFVHPTRLPNNLPYTIASAQAAKKLGFKFLLDLHYSDTWADPGKQFTPKAWAGMSHEQLVEQVYTYTRNTIEAFRKAGVLPNMVQIGNEITNGMLWPDGKLPAHWKQVADLLKAGINGVDAGHGNEPRPLIMIHIDRGGDWKTTHYFFDHLAQYHVPYDVIGESYYPWWQGSLNQLRYNLYMTATTFHKPVILAEVAYPWKTPQFHIPAKFLKTHPKLKHLRPNFQMGAPPFPMTPAGQKDFLQAVYRTVLNTPDNLGKGIFWWEPAVPNKSPLRIRGFFDDSGNALPVVTVFDEYTRR